MLDTVLFSALMKLEYSYAHLSVATRSKAQTHQIMWQQ
ncbi:hypothetical protein DUGA2_49020 [Duganella sp. HH101]|nr:hypothetical protein DUGA2_49020 [Duganella sp. HH101]